MDLKITVSVPCDKPTLAQRYALAQKICGAIPAIQEGATATHGYNTERTKKAKAPKEGEAKNG